ncbi:hypothetical protein SNE40_010899 [Patella caerulea]|uniref:Uncharacterized protein n=1 Tax=Patella caerulea TaxID=87958 RepID=A0AAN8JWW2_PATCE
MKRNRDGSGTSFWADRRQILRSSAEHMKKVEEWLRAGDARFVIQPPDSSAAETYDLNLPEGIPIDSSTNNNGVIQDNYSCLSSDCEDEDETVRITCFNCDAPARAFIKQIKGHTAYFSCERCVQRGEWHDNVTLPCVYSPFRTDVSFDEMQDEDHHGPIPTPLRQLSLGLVSQIVLDPMHLVYLGVTRRLIWLWKKGPVGVCRISANKVKIISESMLSLHCYIPREFPRKCRSLYEVDRWKATEFRQFLLYSGILVLKKNLPAELYYHFLLLYVAIFCMSNPSRYISYCEFSRELLLKFVSEFSGHYGRNQLVYNIHNIIHLADDVQRHGTLDSFSALKTFWVN